MTNRVFIFLILSASILLVTCQKEPISTDPSYRLGFSVDTLAFDTVFTTIGSSTRNFRVYNNNSQSVVISSVRLAGGSSSYFRMNVDGEPTSHASNIEIRSGDSLYVFVEVTVDPTNQDSPLLMADSIIFSANGNTQDVKLVAWGQDVHLYDSLIVEQDLTLTADKPHLVYNYIFVDEDATLTIEPGTRLHFHSMAGMGIAGTLDVKGEPDNPVVFEGDRLEEFYRDKAGQWYGIWLFAGSHSNTISWAEIRNAVVGVTVDSFTVANEPTLIIENSRVENMSGAALHGRGAIIEASNSLFANAAQAVLSLKYGGQYRFYHSTIANYWGYYMHRQGPAVVLNNFYLYREDPDDNQSPLHIQVRDMEEAYFGNCIIYGSLGDELDINNEFNDIPVDAKMNYLFENCILKASDVDITNSKHFINVINEDPLFVNHQEYNYELDSLSPARNIGSLDIALQFPFDLNNISRLADEGPDLGAYEWVSQPDDEVKVGWRR